MRRIEGAKRYKMINASCGLIDGLFNCLILLVCSTTNISLLLCMITMEIWRLWGFEAFMGVSF